MACSISLLILYVKCEVLIKTACKKMPKIDFVCQVVFSVK